MSWAKYAKEALRRGETVTIRPRGHSMKGKVNHGATVTVEPCDAGPSRKPIRAVIVDREVEVQGLRK